MRPLLGGLLLIILLFFTGIGETSGLLRRIFTGKKSSNDDEDTRALSIYGTSRMTAPLPRKQNPTQKSHQALDLQESQAYVQASSHQRGSAEVLDNVNSRKKNAEWLIKHLRNNVQQRTNVQNLNKPTKIPEVQEKKSNKISIDSNKITHDSRAQVAFDEFMRAPFLQGPYSPPGQGSVDLFNKHYGQKAHLPDNSAKKALKLYESYKNRPVRYTENPVDAEGEKRTRRSKKNL